MCLLQLSSMSVLNLSIMVWWYFFFFITILWLLYQSVCIELCYESWFICCRHKSDYNFAVLFRCIIFLTLSPYQFHTDRIPPFFMLYLNWSIFCRQRIGFLKQTPECAQPIYHHAVFDPYRFKTSDIVDFRIGIYRFSVDNRTLKISRLQ